MGEGVPRHLLDDLQEMERTVDLDFAKIMRWVNLQARAIRRHLKAHSKMEGWPLQLPC